MRKPKRQGKTWLFAIAKAVANELKRRCNGANLRIRLPQKATTTNTDGWRARIGDLGNGQPRLEIWFDRFTRYDERKLWAGFYSPQNKIITKIADRVARKLRPHRVITEKDVGGDKLVLLRKRLPRNEFYVPIFEKYTGNSFYGIYDQTRFSSAAGANNFHEIALDFFLDVAGTLPNPISENEEHEIYPQIEDRKLVKSHVQRERSRLLARERKARDNYECQICNMKFEEIYGSIGETFAEAHHIIPLAKLKSHMKTHLEDLITVCANCHRMLHKMDGKREDVRKLKRIVRRLA